MEYIDLTETYFGRFNKTQYILEILWLWSYGFDRVTHTPSIITAFTIAPTDSRYLFTHIYTNINVLCFTFNNVSILGGFNFIKQMKIHVF